MNKSREYEGGFRVRINDSGIYIDHPKGRCSMMTSADGGGYLENIGCVSLVRDVSKGEGFIIEVSPDLESVSVVPMEFGKTHVTALAIADTECQNERGYAVSVVLMVGAELPQASMARAAITVTEAITCSFQQLMVGNLHSKDIESGSDSVCVTVLSDIDCGNRLYSTGKHSKLGELIGKASISAVTSSMNLNGTTVDSQAQILKRLERFGVTEDSFRDSVEKFGKTADKMFWKRLGDISLDSYTGACVSSVIQIVDEISWGLIPFESGYEVGHKIICSTISDVIPEGNLIDEIVSAIANKVISDSKDSTV